MCLLLETINLPLSFALPKTNLFFTWTNICMKGFILEVACYDPCRYPHDITYRPWHHWNHHGLSEELFLCSKSGDCCWTYSIIQTFASSTNVNHNINAKAEEANTWEFGDTPKEMVLPAATVWLSHTFVLLARPPTEHKTNSESSTRSSSKKNEVIFMLEAQKMASVTNSQWTDETEVDR